MVTPQHISAADVLLDMEAGNKRRVLEALSTEAARRSGRAEADILAALQAREELGSTALGRGVALPHARMAGDHPPLMLFARLSKPIDYEARDEEPVDLVILVLWPEASPEGFLPTLAATCRPLRAPAALRRLRSATAPEEVVAVLERYGAADADAEDDR